MQTETEAVGAPLLLAFKLFYFFQEQDLRCLKVCFIILKMHIKTNSHWDFQMCRLFVKMTGFKADRPQTFQQQESWDGIKTCR